MGETIKRVWSGAAMKAGGFIGSFQVDYLNRRMRGNGMTGPYLQVLKSKMLIGVSLSEIEPAFHPHDLNKAGCLRSGFAGAKGRYRTHFRVYDRYKGCFFDVDAQLSVHVDQSGTPESAEGFLTDVSGFAMDSCSNSQGDLLSIARHLKEARLLAERNHLGDLSQDLAKAFKYAGSLSADRQIGEDRTH